EQNYFNENNQKSLGIQDISIAYDILQDNVRNEFEEHGSSSTYYVVFTELPYPHQDELYQTDSNESNRDASFQNEIHSDKFHQGEPKSSQVEPLTCDEASTNEASTNKASTNEG
ncbi:10604_t:CDS:2, partial [Gigaspora rosea]